MVNQEREELAIQLHCAWWHEVVKDIGIEKAKANWDSSPETLKECYRRLAEMVLSKYVLKENVYNQDTTKD